MMVRIGEQSVRNGEQSTAGVPALVHPALVLLCCIISVSLGLIALLSGASIVLFLLAVGILPFSALLIYAVRNAIRIAGKIDLFSPSTAFPISYALWFFFGSLGLSNGRERIWTYSSIGLLAYLLGTATIRQRIRRKQSRAGDVRNTWEHKAFFRSMILLSLLAAGSYLYIILHMGVPILSPDAGEIRLNLANYGPASAVWFTSAYTVFLFLVTFFWSSTLTGASRFAWFAWIVVLSVALLSLGSRGFLTVPLITAVIARNYLGKRLQVTSLLVVAAVLFMALGAYGYTRDTLLSRGTLDLGQDDSVYARFFPFISLYLYVVGPIDTLQQVTETIPQKVGYQHGILTFGALRTVLPGHHEMSDMYFKKLLGSDFIGGGQPATLLGPFYGDFGLTGIVFGMYLLGVLLKAFYVWMQSHPGPFTTMIYAWAMQTALFSLFGAIFPYITTLWLPLFWSALHGIVLQSSSSYRRTRAILSPAG